MIMFRKIFSCLYKPKKEYVYPTVNNIKEWSAFEIDIFTELNREYRLDKTIVAKAIRYITRKKHKPFIPDKNMYKGTEKRIKYMHEVGKITHDKLGVVRDELNNQGIGVVGEVLGILYTKPKSLVKAWKNSPKHHKILSDKKHKYIGIKAERDDVGRMFICCLVGKEKLIK